MIKKLPSEYRSFHKNNLMQGTIIKTNLFVSNKVTKFVAILDLISNVPDSQIIPEFKVFCKNFDLMIKYLNKINVGFYSWLVIIKESLDEKTTGRLLLNCNPLSEHYRKLVFCSYLQNKLSLRTFYFNDFLEILSNINETKININSSLIEYFSDDEKFNSKDYFKIRNSNILPFGSVPYRHLLNIFPKNYVLKFYLGFDY